MDKNKDIKTTTVTESRLGMYSGWKGSFPIITPWGVAKIEGKGLGQAHADVIDFLRSYHKIAGPDDDGSGRYVVKAALTKYFKMKGIKSDPATFHELVKEIKAIGFDIKTPDGKYAFNMLDFCGYREKEVAEWRDAQEMIESRGEDRLFKKGASKGIRPPSGALYTVRFTKEFMDMMAGEIQADYSELLPDIMKSTDIQKRAARFFLSHDHFDKHGTDNLACLLWPNHAKESYQTRKYREDGLKKNADMLRKTYGIQYDIKRDYWAYLKHPAVTFVYPEEKKVKKFPM